MQKIIPHLWFDKEAKEAAEFYTSIFPNSKITSATVLKDTPSGDCDVMAFEIDGYQFMSISAGPLFKINPSISFILNFDPSKDSSAKENLDKLWEKLSEGGQALTAKQQGSLAEPKVLMPLDKYPFSERYGWIQDKYGVSWQLILSNPAGEDRPFLTPSLMFTKDNVGRAEEAINFYLSVFKDSKMGMIQRWPAGMEPEKEGNVMYADFVLEKQWFASMESAGPHEFIFNEAISFMVNCDTQEEIDYYWEKLSASPENEQCGWCKDKFGVSWQIIPSDLEEMLRSEDQEKVKRITEAFLKMKKFDIAELKKAAEGK